MSLFPRIAPVLAAAPQQQHNPALAAAEAAATITEAVWFLAIFLYVLRFWCRRVARKLPVGSAFSRRALTWRLVRAMSWRMGLLLLVGLPAFFIYGVSADCGARFLVFGLFSLPFAMFSVWRHGRRISHDAFAATCEDATPAAVTQGQLLENLRALGENAATVPPPPLIRHVSQSAYAAGLRTLRVRPTILEGICLAATALTIGWLTVEIVTSRSALPQELASMHPQPLSTRAMQPGAAASTAPPSAAVQPQATALPPDFDYAPGQLPPQATAPAPPAPAFDPTNPAGYTPEQLGEAPAPPPVPAFDPTNPGGYTPEQLEAAGSRLAASLNGKTPLVLTSASLTNVLDQPAPIAAEPASHGVTSDQGTIEGVGMVGNDLQLGVKTPLSPAWVEEQAAKGVPIYGALLQVKGTDRNGNPFTKKVVIRPDGNGYTMMSPDGNGYVTVTPPNGNRTNTLDTASGTTMSTGYVTVTQPNGNRASAVPLSDGIMGKPELTPKDVQDANARNAAMLQQAEQDGKSLDETLANIHDSEHAQAVANSAAKLFNWVQEMGGVQQLAQQHPLEARMAGDALNKVMHQPLVRQVVLNNQLSNAMASLISKGVPAADIQLQQRLIDSGVMKDQQTLADNISGPNGLLDAAARRQPYRLVEAPAQPAASPSDPYVILYGVTGCVKAFNNDRVVCTAPVKEPTALGTMMKHAVNETIALRYCGDARRMIKLMSPAGDATFKASVGKLDAAFATKERLHNQMLEVIDRITSGKGRPSASEIGRGGADANEALSLLTASTVELFSQLLPGLPPDERRLLAVRISSNFPEEQTIYDAAKSALPTFGNSPPPVEALAGINEEVWTILKLRDAILGNR